MIHCNVKRCVGCRTCEVVCSTHHFGAVLPGLSRIRVAKLEEIGIDMAVACLSCSEKPCIECPTGALSVGDRGEIVVQTDRCESCEACVDACPIGAVGFHDGRPLFCNLCEGNPSCVGECPSHALSYREEPRDISLRAFMGTGGTSPSGSTSSGTSPSGTSPGELPTGGTLPNGTPGQKRARYAEVQGEPLRKTWKNGARVDS